jgi:RNA-directed DNA polymerase
MNGIGKSDARVVPEKSPNKGSRAKAKPTAEGMEGRRAPEGNPREGSRRRTQRRESLKQDLERIRAVAKGDKRVRLTALWHHVYRVERLREAYEKVRKDAAAGVDGVTWESYGRGLEDKLQDLSERLRRGAYRAPPVRRTYIAKADGRQRPIGVPTLEDKVVQRATVEVLNAVYEADFLGFSYGFRPGRSQHRALDAIAVAIQARKVSWVLEVDIRGFFDTIDHGWLLKFVEHRVGDVRVQRQIRKWVKAGVLEDGKRRETEEGTPQGGSVSPLLANIYLHYVFDLWVERWRKREAEGEVVVVRYADDIVLGFQRRAEAERFREALAERMRQFHLELHPEKTRLLEFGRFAAESRERRGGGKPETFDFLGFTHYCTRTRNGRFTVGRRTIRGRQRRKLHEVKAELVKRRHERVVAVGEWLGSVLRGHAQYYGVPGNYRSLQGFRYEVVRLWWRQLRRRSQHSRFSWGRMQRLVKRWLPQPRIVHPHPAQRLRVTT